MNYRQASKRVDLGLPGLGATRTRDNCEVAVPKEDLEKAVVHLAFDVQHFLCYVELHKNLKLVCVCPAAAQAVAYAMLIHLRLLLDFFYGPPKQDDCWVGDFKALPGFSVAFPEQILSPTCDERQLLSTHLNKRLAHLTATRWRERAPSMDYYEQHFADVARLIDRFTDALPGELQATFLRERYKWEKRHPPTI